MIPLYDNGNGDKRRPGQPDPQHHTNPDSGLGSPRSVRSDASAAPTSVGHDDYRKKGGKAMNRRMAVVLAAAVLSTVVVLGREGTAQAAGAQYVEGTTALDSTSPKVAVAECPAGMAVLGGAASINGGEGQVVIQAAFPEYDGAVFKHQFVVKAVEEPADETAKSWSVTAGAYCTSATVPVYQSASSAFNSDPIKTVPVECPEGTKVVGMGGEVSKSDATDPAAIVGSIPAAKVVFQGFEADPDLTMVTARATEVGGPLGGGFSGSWKVTAVAACGYAYAFEGLELRSNVELGGGFLEGETESKLYIGCSVGKKIIAAASTIEDEAMGQWYLDRFSRNNALRQGIYAEAHRNPELGNVLVNQAGYVICVKS